MNLIATNLDEAREQLQSILKDLETDPDYSEVDLLISLEHVYHHLNYAWHIRNVEATISIGNRRESAHNYLQGF